MNKGWIDDYDPILYPNEENIQIDTLVYLQVYDLQNILSLERDDILIDDEFLFHVLVFYNMKPYVFESQCRIQPNIYHMQILSNNKWLLYSSGSVSYGHNNSPLN